MDRLVDRLEPALLSRLDRLDRLFAKILILFFIEFYMIFFVCYKKVLRVYKK